MARTLSDPFGHIQEDANDWWHELDEALINGILAPSEDYARGGDELPSDAAFKRALDILKEVRELAREVRKGR